MTKAERFVGTQDEVFFAKAIKQLKSNDYGLVATGGDLKANQLLSAYYNGVFPWFNQGEAIAWYSPDPRMILTPERLHVSRSLNKQLKRFHIKVNGNFSAVIGHCASVVRKDQQGTWINKDMIKAYTALHKKGDAHSIEAYQDEKLVGGLYGVALGQVFFGESMFSLVSNASKVVLVYLLTQMPYRLLDCQVFSHHLQSLGAETVTRHCFMTMLTKLR